MILPGKVAVAGIFCVFISCSKSSGGGGGGGGGPGDPPPNPDKTCQAKQKEYVLQSNPLLSLSSTPEDVVAAAFAKDSGFWEGMPKCAD